MRPEPALFIVGGDVGDASEGKHPQIVADKFLRMTYVNGAVRSRAFSECLIGFPIAWKKFAAMLAK